MLSSVFEYIILGAEAISAFSVIAAFFIKPFRVWLTGSKERKEREELLEEGLRCLLRNDIKDFYNSRAESKQIRQYEYENIEKMYKAYKSLGGNSFVDKLWKEICTWAISE